MDWYRNLRIVLLVEDKLPFLEQPIPAMPVPPVGQVLPSNVLNTYTAWVKASKEIVGLMLMTMDPDIQKNMDHLGAYDMLKGLKNVVCTTGISRTSSDRERTSRVQTRRRTAGKGNQGNGKAKMGDAPVAALPFAPKPKNPPTPKKDNPAKDAICHECGEVGYWRRNCPIYLVEFMKKKKLSQGASTSSIFTIELYTFPSTS
nr:zinc finger, CCHC-type [Tanacetum cinerariifolium]